MILLKNHFAFFPGISDKRKLFAVFGDMPHLDVAAPFMPHDNVLRNKSEFAQVSLHGAFFLDMSRQTSGIVSSHLFHSSSDGFITFVTNYLFKIQFETSAKFLSSIAKMFMSIHERVWQPCCSEVKKPPVLGAYWLFWVGFQL